MPSLRKYLYVSKSSDARDTVLWNLERKEERILQVPGEERMRNWKDEGSCRKDQLSTATSDPTAKFYLILILELLILSWKQIETMTELIMAHTIFSNSISLFEFVLD